MAKFGDGGELLKCSFCGKSQKQVKKLIAGPGVYICDECIDLCNEIIEEELATTEELPLTELPKPVGEPGGGMANALLGSAILVGLASAVGMPVGILAGIYLAEYGTMIGRLCGVC